MGKELPNGWVKAKMGDFVKLKNGYAFKSHDFIDEGISVVRISDIKNNKVSLAKSAKVSSELYYENFTVENGDVLIAMSGATTGKYGIYQGDEIALQNQRVGNLKPLIDDIPKKFIYYLLGNLKEEIEEAAYGAAQPNISSKLIEDMDVGLPPLPEQKRIVARLDALFRHLDVLKTKLDRIPELLKNFRQQVLTQAVTGKLTKGTSINQWESLKLSELISHSANGLAKRRGDVGDPVTVLRLADFRNAARIKGNERQIILTEKEKEKYVLDTNDILIIRVNGSVDLAGLFILYEEQDQNEGYCDHFIRIKLNSDRIIPQFLIFITNEGEGRRYLRNSLSTSAGQNTINQKSIGNLKIQIPSIGEQNLIIERVNSLFALAYKIESQYQSLKAKIDNLPQAILNKAFKGELVPQDPNDEPASVLLERIKEQREGKVYKKKERLSMAAEERGEYGGD